MREYEWMEQIEFAYKTNSFLKTLPASPHSYHSPGPEDIDGFTCSQAPTDLPSILSLIQGREILLGLVK